MKLFVSLAAAARPFKVLQRRPAEVPKRLYHGTYAPEFDRFQLTSAGKHDEGYYGRGIYLGDYDTALGYIAKYRQQNRKLGTAPRILEVAVTGNPKLYPLNPMETQIAKNDGGGRGTILYASRETKTSEQLRAAVLEAGFDGVVAHVGLDKFEYVFYNDKNVRIEKQNVYTEKPIEKRVRS